MRARVAAMLVAMLLAGCGPTGAGPTGGAPTATIAPAPVETPTPTIAPTPTAAPTLTLPDGVAIHPADPTAGVPLGYISYVPPGVSSGPRPLLLFLHGSGESGRGTVLSLRLLFGTGITKLLWDHTWPADRPFIVLAPQHDNTSIDCFTADEIDGFLRRSIAQYDVDPARVYITGVSCGAYGGWDYLGDHTDERVAAAVLFAGDGRNAFAVAGCRLGRVPIWAIAGELDQVVDPIGSSDPIAKLKACTTPKAVDARLTIVPDIGHVVWDRVYAGYIPKVDVFAWLLSHRHA